MALTSPIDLEAFENAVKRWFNHATGLTTIWSGEHAPQPPYPYASLKVITGPIQYGHDDERHSTDPDGPTGEEVTVEVCGSRDITVSCQVYSACDRPRENAQHYIGIAQGSLGLPSVLEALLGAGVSVIDSTPPQDLDFIASGAIKSRAAMDVRFRISSSMSERTGYIATSSGTGTFTKPDGSTVETTFGG